MKKFNRRNFIEKSATGFIVAGMLPVASCSRKNDDCLDNRFIHHVLFWLKDPADPDVRKKFESELRKLITIETIVEKHLGIPAQTPRDIVDNSYTYSLFISFHDKEGHDVYQVHPKHLEFAKQCENLWKRVIIYDSVNF
jgi:hypothetical protein